MLKFVFPTMFAMLISSSIMTAEAAPDAALYALFCGNATAATPLRSVAPLASKPQNGVLQIRDVRSSGANGGNGCWNACFTDFDECMGIRTKNLCVSRVKTCLETCERLSSRPGM